MIVSTLKAILIDHDGTLVSSEHLHFKMWQTILGDYHVALQFDEYEQHYAGVPTVTNAARMIDKYPQITTTAATLIAAKETATQHSLAHDAFPLMAGAKETLAYFSGLKLKIAIVTGAGFDGVRATIAAYDLQDQVDIVVSGDDVEFSKPAPDCYLYAMQKLGVTAAECVVIEDTESGVAAATGANLACVAVPSAKSGQRDFNNALKICENLHAAKDWIAEYYQLGR